MRFGFAIFFLLLGLGLPPHLYANLYANLYEDYQRHNQQPNQQHSLNDSGIFPSCHSDILKALNLGTELSALVRLAPGAKSTSADTTANPDATSPVPALSKQALLQQLLRVVEPLRAGGALAEILQSPFFHEALAEEAFAHGWNPSDERFSHFFPKLNDFTRVNLMRALTVRLWLYTFRSPQQFRGPVRPEELLRYQSLLNSFMSTRSDELVHHFLARLEFEADQSDAEIHRVLLQPDPYTEKEPAIYLKPHTSLQEFVSSAKVILTAQPERPQIAFAYWMALNRRTCSASVQKMGLQQLFKSGFYSAETDTYQGEFHLPLVDSDYLSTLDHSVLLLRVNNLRWRLAMSRITNPTQEIAALKTRITDSVRSVEGTGTQSRVMMGILRVALQYLGLGWVGYSLQESDIDAYAGVAQAVLPEHITQMTNSVFSTLTSLEAQLTDWVGQVNAIGNASALEDELNRLLQRLPPPDSAANVPAP